MKLIDRRIIVRYQYLDAVYTYSGLVFDEDEIFIGLEEEKKEGTIWLNKRFILTLQLLEDDKH